MRFKLLNRMWTLRFPLLRKNAGYCADPHDPDHKRVIEVDDRLRGKECLRVLVHEILHAADFHKDENWCHDVSRVIAKLAFEPDVRARIWGDGT